MTLTSVLLTILWLIVVPVTAGSVFAFKKDGFITEGCRKEGNGRRQMGIILWSWFLGQLLLWCIFQIIAVWIILKKNDFSLIVKMYSGSTAVVCGVAIVVNVIRQIKRHVITELMKIQTGEKDNLKRIANTKQQDNVNADKVMRVVWIVFAVILVLQTVLQVRLAYMDADDAYYVSEAVSMQASNRMYNLVPYTGITTEMDYRHSLEPFPAWLAFLSEVTGVRVVSMAHVLMPAILLPLTYGVYALMGNRVLGKNRDKLPIYLVVTELLVFFSLYSTKIPEKFFVTRIRQGKATIASLIIPGIILSLFLILDYAKEKKRTDLNVWIMLFMLNTAGCLCSTLGALICVMPIAIVAVMMIFAYKKGWHLIPMIIGCMPCLLFAALYVLNR